MNDMEIIILVVCCALYYIHYKVCKVVDKLDGNIGWIMCKLSCIEQQLIWIREDVEDNEKFNSREYSKDESQDNT